MGAALTEFITDVGVEFIAMVVIILGGTALIYGGLLGLGKFFSWVSVLIGKKDTEHDVYTYKNGHHEVWRAGRMRDSWDD